jgi:hypothetical protein
MPDRPTHTSSQVRLPDGTFSREFPAYYGLGSDLSDEQKAARGPGMHIEKAPDDIQELFDKSLTKIAKCQGYKSSAHYIQDGLGGVVYHYTLNFMGAHSIEHVDEPDYDGAGLWIWNTALQICGLFYLLDPWARPNGTQLPMSAVWQETGDCIGFSGDARIYMVHGVLREGGTAKLQPRITDESKEGSSWRENVRIVGTIRGGLVPPTMKRAWYQHFSKHYRTLSGKTKKAEKPKVEVEMGTLRASSRLAVVAPAPHTPTTSSRTSSAAACSHALVAAHLGHLPQIGDVINGNQCKYGSCTVLALCSNFVVTSVVSTRRAINLKAGTQFKVRLPPFDDEVTVVDVLLVGEIWGKTKASTKYRCAVVRCKRGDAPRGGLETLEAVGFPAETHCKVTAHITAHTHKHTERPR